jgi:hypothetical protein
MQAGESIALPTELYWPNRRAKVLLYQLSYIGKKQLVFSI